MANTVKIKRSAVSGKIPLVGDLEFGELALNTFDGKLYTKVNSGGADSIKDLTVAASSVTSVFGRGGDVVLTAADILPIDGVGSGIDSDLLDGQHGTFYRNAANLDSGTIPAARLTGSYDVTVTDSAKLGGIVAANYLKNNLPNTTIGVGVVGAINLDISDPGVGNSSGFRFLKANDSAGISVTETSSDLTLYEFYMSDNPDSGDYFSWRYTDWQSPNGIWQPLYIGGLESTYSARSHTFRGNISQAVGAYFTTANWGGTSAQFNVAQYNNAAKLKVATGTASTLTISQFNVSNYTGVSGDVVFIRVIGTGSTFSWGTGYFTNTPVETNLAISTTGTTLSNGIVVSFSALSGVVGDVFAARSWRAATSAFGPTTINGSLSITSTALATNLNADLLDGLHGSSFTRVDLTNLGKVGSFAFDSTTNTSSKWGLLPVGYSAMFASTIGTAGGAPNGDFGYFHKIANRDTGNGWAGMWVSFSTNDVYIGKTSTDATFATWDKMWSSGNDGAGSGLDSDLLDGLDGSYYLNYNNLTNKPASSNATSSRQVFTATTSQTVFSIAYTVGYVDVYYEGEKLVPTKHFTATNGTTVVLNNPATAGNTVEIIAFTTFVITEVYTKTEVDATFLKKADSYSTSDIRAKTNVRALGYGLDTVMAMLPKKYEMISTGETSIGFIAQDMELLVPEVVGDNGEYKGINYELLTAILVASVKTLKLEIDSLKTELNEIRELIK